MLDLTGNSHSNCEGVTRRSFLKIGSLGLAGLTLPDLLRLRAAEAAAGKNVADTAVIQLWCGGGPTQIETYDPKPDAPVEYRGPLKPIRTKVSGIDICEVFPRQAQLADKFAIIRSCAHKESGHGSATKNLLSGYPHPPNTNEGSLLYPSVGSVVAKVRESERRNLPHYVCVPNDSVGRGNGETGSAYLGAAYNPFGASPNDGPKSLMVPPELTAQRLENRRGLLTALDRLRRDSDASGMLDGMDAFTRQAFEMVSGKAARAALDLSLESVKVKEKYGHGTAVDRGYPWGQGCLLARRLVEAGVSFVTVVMGSWDDHSKEKEAMEKRGPVFDAAVAALLEDLSERGLDKQVAVVAWGEFGRTPLVNKGGGRDHWPGSMSVLLAGGGMKMGQVIGSTDDKGARPKERPLHPNDVLATLYKHLGIDHTRAFVNPAGRPIPLLPHGEPIAELIG
ncbi:MAG: DUF1501 domain-containing protein [Planctomycetia bacterium]|nr:DUF1501 domain-containing protein [Planctomycetia bacterium]